MENKYKTYKYIKNTSGLKKYDPGAEPIYSGYQGGNNFVLQNSIERDVATIDDNHVNNSITNASSHVYNAVKVLDLYKPWKSIPALNIINTPYRGRVAASPVSSIAAQASPDKVTTGANLAMPKMFLNAASTVTPAASDAASVGAGSAAGNTAGSAAAGAGEAAGNTASSTAGTVTGKILPALSILLGAKDMYQMLDNSETLHGDDFVNELSGRYLENGALKMGPIDIEGANRFGKNQRTASAINGAFSGLSMGLGLGALTGGIGWLAAPLFTLGGLGFGLWKGNKQKHAIEERIDNYNRGAAAYNKQSTAEAENQRIKNDFFNSHHVSADNGLGLHKCDDGVNALMGPFESKIETTKVNGKTRIKSAETKSGIEGLPYGGYRADIIPEHVDNNTAIIGNKYDNVGTPLSLKAIPFVDMFNSQNPYERAIGENALLSIIDEQARTKNDNPKPQYAKDIEKYANGKLLADKGLNMKKYDGGDPSKRYTGKDALRVSNYINGISSLLGFLEGNRELKEANAPLRSLRYSIEDPSSMAAINSLPTVANINPLLAKILDQSRYYNYSIKNNGSLSSGQKLALGALSYKNTLDSYVDAYARKREAEQQMLTNKVGQWLTTSNNIVNRAQQTIDNRVEDFIRANAARYGARGMARKNMLTPIYNAAENLNNNNWMLANIGLYEQDLDRRDRELLAQMQGKSSTPNTSVYTPSYSRFVPQYSFEVPTKLEWDFNKLRRG